MRNVRRDVSDTMPEVAGFDDLMPHFAELAEKRDAAGLASIVPEAEKLIQIAAAASDGWRGAEVISFQLGRKGQVSRMSASAADGLVLSPGDSFLDLLTETGQKTYAAVLRDGGSERLVSAPVLRGGRTSLVGIRKTRSGVAARALITFWRPETAEALRNDFQLSDAETEISRYVFEGLRPKAIADLRARSAETVRSQIKTVFKKTGVSSVLEFTHLVYGLNAHATVNAPGPILPSSGEARLWRGPEWPMDVYCEGPPDAEPLVFFHGCLGGRLLTEEARRRLQSRFVIAPGRPGHGRTPATQTEVAQAPELAARQTLSLLNALGIEQTDILAYDVGVASALTLAAMAPERVKKVVIVAGMPPVPCASDAMKLPMQTRVFLILSHVSARACRSLARLGGERLLAGGPDGFGSVVFANCAADIAACRTREVADIFWRGHGWHTIQGPDGFVSDAALVATRWDSRLERLPMPIVFVHGETDLNAPMRSVKGLADRVGGQLRPVPKAGHALLHARPDAWLSVYENM